MGLSIGSMVGIAKGVIGSIRSGKFSPSGMMRMAKLAMIDSEVGEPQRSEFYFTNVETEEELRLCMSPERVKVNTGTTFRTYNIVERGEVKLPKGEPLTEISWEGILPGAGILLYPFVTHVQWDEPKELLKVFNRWREEGAKLKVLVTETPINTEVYIKTFDYVASGGQGDYKYSIDLVAAKDLQVLTVAEADAQRKRKEEERQNELKQRPRKKSKLGVNIKKLDDLYAGVRLLTGQGSFGDIERVVGASGLKIDSKVMAGAKLLWNLKK